MKTNIINLFGLGLIGALTLTACSDEFLEEKKNYDNVSTDIYNNYTGAERRVFDIYSWCLPTVDSDPTWQYPSTGSDDDQSKSTEEYSGFGAFVDPQSPLNIISGTDVPDYFFGTPNNIQANAWGRIRNVNDVIEGIEGGSLSDSEKDELLGQVYFFRAWCYYNLVRYYGGVPIITEVQEPVESTYTPRSSAKECIEFICSDLDKAAKMLAASTMNGGWSSSKWGYVTTGTALALKGRVLLLWASPLFNRANDQSRWTNAYNTMKAELDSINACGYGLFSTSNNINGSDFALQFNQSGINPEAVFVVLYNTVQSGDGQKNSNWERYIRPKNTTGTGKGASAMLVDMFPMADGKKPGTTDTYTLLESSSYDYDSNYPFMNRDPRFYRTFGFPGVRWAYSGNSTLTDADLNNPSYDYGTNYELWNYVWYTDQDDQDNVESSNCYGADNLLSNSKGIFVRKRSDDYDVNSSPLYNYSAAANTSGFIYSAQPYIELRYAEVLLNLAEVACGAGDMSEAVSLLQQIRARAGYTAENNYGLQANLASDQAACMSAILYERQIELAYEGKRFEDLRRWMLFDGGTQLVDNAPSTWKLTGWGGNTCNYLGFKQLNGQRRENMEFRVADKYGLGSTTYDSDPLLANGGERCAAVDLRQDLTEQLETLKEWYADNLVRKEKKGDSYDSNQTKLYMNFLPRYYFMGIGRSAQSNNTKMPQTIGWEDYNNGGADGTFDPLAE
ncbi:MAG: RagB/SusD family nutrient uptake outer membrane protein [Prevotella sp.]|nr:RagB/SusD family nutrient uptake outer membrane protein [Prevotella sp.]